MGGNHWVEGKGGGNGRREGVKEKKIEIVFHVFHSLQPLLNPLPLSIPSPFLLITPSSFLTPLPLLLPPFKPSHPPKKKTNHRFLFNFFFPFDF